MKILSQLGSEDFQALVNASSYHQFIHLVMSLKSRRGRAFSYAELSRKLGFKSRSYSRDIVIGSKKLTPTLIPSFIKALGLDKDLAAIFEMLVLMESDKTAVLAEKKLKKLKARLLQSLKQEGQAEASYSMPEIPMVYSALGGKEDGATLKEIAARTDLKSETILKALGILTEIGLTKQVQTRYLPLEDHVAFDQLHKSATFKQHFCYLLDKASHHSKLSFDTNEKLFFGSSFSVNKDSLPALKEELRQVLLQYVDHNEISKGDKVVSMVCSLF